MFNDPMYVVALLLSVALLLHVLLFGRITKQDKARNKSLADELETLQGQFECASKSRDAWYTRTNEWIERFKGLEELAAETGEKHKKQITELERSRDGWKDTAKLHALNEGHVKHKMRTTWHAHQIAKKGKQVICLTAIVEASDGPGAVAAFEAQMKDVKAKMRIRSKAPVFAKPVFPNI